MDKEKQIEEMAKIMCSPCPDGKECAGTWCYKRVLDSAENIYNAGYRKLPEDSVVLSREELNKKYVSIAMYELAKAFHDEKCAEFEKLCYDYNKLKNQLVQERKETAEKIYKFVDEYLRYDEENLMPNLANYLKQFGVEIKE